MRFEKIELKNFMSYKNQVFDNFDTPGLVLIEGRNLDQGGSNGAGKSSCFDGLSYGLFGKTVRGDDGEDVINRNIKEECEVTVEFYIGKDEYKVVRKRKSKTNKSLVFYKNGDEIRGGTDKITQQKLLDEIDIDFDLFRCTVVFAQGETFNFVDEGNRQQKEILGKIMRIDFQELLLKVKDKCSTIHSQVDHYDREIIKIEAKIENNKCEEYKKESKDWELEKERVVFSTKEKMDKFDEDIKKYEGIVKDSEHLKNIKNQLLERINNTNDDIDKIKEFKNTDKGKVSELSKERDRLNELEGECPTCLQEVNGSLAGVKASDLLVEIGIHQDGIKKNDRVIGVLLEAKNENVSKYDKLSDMISENDKIIYKLEALKEIKRRLIEEYETKCRSENPWIEKYGKEKIEYEKAIKKLEEFNLEIKNLKDNLLLYEFWVNGFGDAGIKSFIFDLICSTLTARANHYANILTGGSVVLSFDTQKKMKSGEIREKFDCEVITDGEAVSYKSYSGGEKRRISLSVDMALSDLMTDYYKSDFNIVVYDEQDHYMDKEGRVNYMNLLREQAKDKKVFVVAHDAEFKSMFDDSWVIEKKDGISKRVA